MFERRACGTESLDRPDADPRLVEQSYRFMRFVNRAGGGIHVVRRFLEQEFSGPAQANPVRVLDIGAGDCDIPLAVTTWAMERGHAVEFICLDHDTTAFKMAEDAVRRNGCDTIRVEKTDIFTYQPVLEFDYAIGSMFFHHLTDEQIGRLIEHVRSFVRRALLINDLHRCLPNYLVCRMLVIPVDREIRHDALLSIRRGFKPGGLRRILRQHDPAATVRRAWFCRVAGVVRFDHRGEE